MTGASPWSVKGIAPEERELAKQAARRAGVPIGQWLSRQIREAADAERSGRGHTPVDRRFGQPQGGWRSAEAAPAAGSAGPTATAWRSALAVPPPAPDLPHPPPAQYSPAQHPPVAARPPAPTVEPARVRDLERRVQELHDLESRLTTLEKLERRFGALAAELNAMGSRLEDIETRNETREVTLSRSLKTLAAQIEELRARPAVSGDSAGSIATSTAPIERAVMRLAERLQRVEELTLPEERRGRGLLSRLFRRR